MTKIIRNASSATDCFVSDGASLPTFDQLSQMTSTFLMVGHTVNPELTDGVYYYDGKNGAEGGVSKVGGVSGTQVVPIDFVAADWTGVAPNFTLTIPAASHGKGTSVSGETIYEDTGTDLVKVDNVDSVSVNKTTGDVVLTATSAFNGKIILL